MVNRRALLAAGLLLSVACGSPEPAELDAVLGTPVVRRTNVRNLPGGDLWSIDYELRLRSVNCVATTITFLEVDALDTSFDVAFGVPDTFDAPRLTAEAGARLAGCAEGAAIRSRVGSIGGAAPRGPARFRVRAIGVDEHGHEVGLDRTLVLAVTVEP